MSSRPTHSRQLFGIWAAVVTPFRSSGDINAELLLAHCQDCIARGADGVALFGTTGEGASLGAFERSEVLASLVKGGLPAGRIVVAVCANSVADAITQMRTARDNGVSRLLIPPPFYFKGVTDDALFAWYSQVLDAAGADAKVILYHIPQVTKVPLSLALIRRLKKAYPSTVFGLKDSGGQWDYTLAALSLEGTAVLVGDERHLANAAALGAAGAISGMANLAPARLRKMLHDHAEDPEICALVDDVVKIPVTPAVKALVALRASNPEWRRARPPLSSTTDQELAAILPSANPILGLEEV